MYYLRNLHVPYRESELTRLLHDSLGGRTRTCMIATVSPCQFNQEEIVSTLDFASRAKNVHNTPRINHDFPRDTLILGLTSEIERLKRDLLTTRHRNSISLASDAAEKMMKENESWQAIKRQKERIEALDSLLQHTAEQLRTDTPASEYYIRQQGSAFEAQSTWFQFQRGLPCLAGLC